MMAEAMRRFLVRMAALAEASDPEDVAHNIILQALQGRVKIKDGQAQTYLKVAARNQSRTQARRQQVIKFHTAVRYDFDGLRQTLLLDEPERLTYAVDYAAAADARIALRNLFDINRDAVMELIEYSEDGPHSVRQRVRVHRLRQELRR